METGLLIIFWYGVLHAFAPDHLAAIADFSIGRSMTKTMIITAMFAFGHGLMLFVFARVLESRALPESLTRYGDTISAVVIVGIGIYLLVMVITDRIRLDKHTHAGKEHIHIWFGREHSHDAGSAPAWTLGALMGIGGVRGMLVTLGMLDESNGVQWTMVIAFVSGVSLIFITFGAIILQLNRHLLSDLVNVRRAFTVAGITSVAVGGHMLML